MGNACNRRRNGTTHILDNNVFLQRNRPAAIGAIKLLKAVMKIRILLKARIAYSRVCSWQKVHRDEKHSQSEDWKKMASMRGGKFPHILGSMRSGILCEHLTRDTGKLKFNPNAQITPTPHYLRMSERNVQQ